ncbi:hypothetical protein DSO57_1023783 [Entomophthora muscae]|uniref:Uncharacterized protein n=1 Tax=Entomophthora muscae TaxID=34485 RepID=A0ACC2U0X4_9FUNG|nr:hypothetical protein DSO57_1023783 [Entomophthora muscae]
MKFTAFIISSILATPVPYYATEVDSGGQEKSANSYKQAYGTQEQGVDETKAAYGDVRAISNNKQAYVAQEQGVDEAKAAYGDVRAIGDNKNAYDPKEHVSGDNKAAYADVRAIGDNRQAYSPKEQISGGNKAAYGIVRAIGDVKSGGGENKQAYGDVKSMDDMNVDNDYNEEWNPAAIDEEWEFNVKTNLEDKKGNQGYSSEMVQDWDTSTRQISHENEDWDGINRDNQEWSYMPNDNQGWKEGRAWKDMNNIRTWNSMQNVDEGANKMDHNECGSTRQSNGKMFQRHSMAYRQKY